MNYKKLLLNNFIKVVKIFIIKFILILLNIKY